MNREEFLNNWDISRHGDALEITACSWIRSNLPSYEIIWKNFIGQKEGKPAPMQNCSSELNIKRKHFSEYHFTILESLYFMNWLKDQQSLRKVENFDEYIGVLTSLTSFLAYSGRVRDVFEKMCVSIGLKGLSKEGKKRLDNFYYQRNIFLHEKKIPFNLDADGRLCIAKPKTSDVDIGFGDKMLWEEAEGIVNADVYMEEYCASLNKEMNILLDLVAQEVKRIIKNENLVIDPPPVRPLDEYYYLIYSGSLNG